MNGAYIPLLNKMDVALLKRCESAVAYGNSLVKGWLKKFMFRADTEADAKAQKVVDYFSGHKQHLTHGRPLIREEIRSSCPLPIVDLETLGGDVAAKVWEYHYRFEFIFTNNSQVAKIFHSEGEYMVLRTGSMQFVLGQPVPPAQPQPLLEPQSPPPKAEVEELAGG